MITEVEVLADETTRVDCALGGTWLTPAGADFADACASGGAGGDGILDAGERIDLELSLANPGIRPATAVTASLSSTSPEVSIVAGSTGFDDIPAGGTASALAPLSFVVHTGAVCGAVIELDLALESTEGSWSARLSQRLGDFEPAAGVLLSESFDSVAAPDLPPGWAADPPEGNGGLWDTSGATVHPNGVPPHSGQNLAFFNSWTAESDERAQLLSERSLSLVGASTATLSFWMYHEDGHDDRDDRLQARVSIDGGTLWSSASPPISRYGAPGWEQHTVNLGPWLGEPDLRIGFLGRSEWGNDCHIDDVELSFTAPGS
mgnify:CR=1 FL=1